MQILEMNIADISEVTALAAQLGYENSEGEIAARFQEIKNSEDSVVFVAKSESGKVLGWIQVNREPVCLLAGPRAEVTALVVDERHRGQKIGRALLLHVEDWARERNIPLLRVRSNVIRHDAHRFYEREGYQLSKTSNLFIKSIP